MYLSSVWYTTSSLLWAKGCAPWNQALLVVASTPAAAAPTADAVAGTAGAANAAVAGTAPAVDVDSTAVATDPTVGAAVVATSPAAATALVAPPLPSVVVEVARQKLLPRQPSRYFSHLS